MGRGANLGGDEVAGPGMDYWITDYEIILGWITVLDYSLGSEQITGLCVVSHYCARMTLSREYRL